MSKTPRDKTDAEHYFKGFVVACHENGKENAMRLIKHFSSECKDDWKMESDLVNELGETEHPNILTYCWHGEGMCLVFFFFFVFGNVTFCVELCFSGGYLAKLGKNPSTRTRSRTYDIPIILY